MQIDLKAMMVMEMLWVVVLNINHRWKGRQILDFKV